MAEIEGKKISELAGNANINGTAVFPHTQNNVTMKVTLDAIAAFILSQVDESVVEDAVTAWLTAHPEATTTVADGSITTAKLANGAVTTDKLADSAIISLLPNDFKTAILQLASKVAYIDAGGQTYYDDLHDALYPPIPATAITLNDSSISFTTIGSTQTLTATVVPSNSSDTVVWSSSDTSVATVNQSGVVTSVAYGSATITATAGSVYAVCSVVISQATLSSITAVYTQSGTVYPNTSLDSLKTDLVVTANWSDSSQTTVEPNDYVLSGTLSVGTSTVTVTYGEKTTTFSVTVTAAPTVASISAVYTQSGIVYDTDSLNSLKSDLVVTATWTDTSTTTVPGADYTLSGTLTAGTSTITVTYSGQTTTFTVTVSSATIVDQNVTMDGYTHTLVSGGITYDTTKTYSFVYTFGTLASASGNGNKVYGPVTSNNAQKDGALQYLQSSSQWRAIMSGQGKNFTPVDGDVLCYVHDFSTQWTRIYLNGTQIYATTTGTSYYNNTDKIIIQSYCSGMTVGITHIKIAQGDLH